MDKKEIISLAELSRLEISDSDIDAYKKDFDGILDYINSISKVDIAFSDHYQTNLTENYMREDNHVYEAGEFSDDILDIVPQAKEGYVKVKKVL